MPRLSRRARRAFLGVALVVGLAVPAVPLSAPAGADPSSAVSEAVDAYQQARARLRSAEDVLRDAEAQRVAAQQVSASATQALAAADDRLADQRGRYARLSAEYYVRQGSKDDTANDSMRLALSGRREVLDRAKSAQDAAEDDRDEAAKTLATREKAQKGATDEHAAALAEADRLGAEADQAIADTGARDLPAVAYIAYRDAAAATDAAQPDCHLSAAVLAGIGRISSGHGRNQGSTIDHLGRVDPALRGLRGRQTADTDGGTIDGDEGADRAVGPLQLTPAAWASGPVDGDGDGQASPDSLFDSAATAGPSCAPTARPSTPSPRSTGPSTPCSARASRRPSRWVPPGVTAAPRASTSGPSPPIPRPGSATAAPSSTPATPTSPRATCWG